MDLADIIKSILMPYHKHQLLQVRKQLQEMMEVEIIQLPKSKRDLVSLKNRYMLVKKVMKEVVVVQEMVTIVEVLEIIRLVLLV